MRRMLQNYHQFGPTSDALGTSWTHRDATAACAANKHLLVNILPARRAGVWPLLARLVSAVRTRAARILDP
jgi:hypothetical protein